MINNPDFDADQAYCSPNYCEMGGNTIYLAIDKSNLGCVWKQLR